MRRHLRRLLFLVSALLVAVFPVPSWAQGQCGTYKTFGTSEVLTASDLNNSLVQAATTNSTLECVRHVSGTLAAMQTTTDPTGGSLATSAAGEIYRLRFMIGRISGQSQWYQNPSPLVPPGDIHAGVANTRSAGVILFHSSSSFRTGLYSGNTTASADYFWPTGPGTASQVLTWGAGNQLSWTTVAAGALTRVGGNTTEATTTATSVTDLVTVSPSAITAATPILITFNWRKTTSGVASTWAFSLTLNATVNVVASARLTGNEDVARNGFGMVWIGPRVTSYLQGVAVYSNASSNDQSAVATYTDMPTADITTIILRGHNGGGGGAATLGIDEVHVYTLSTSSILGEVWLLLLLLLLEACIPWRVGRRWVRGRP